MTISLVVAASRNGVIGRDGALPWHLPDDLRHFKRLTLGKPVIMGRRTWESIGKPLPGRRNIVLTRDPGFSAPGCEVAHSVNEALALLDGDGEAMVIGGAQVYAAFLPLADCVYLTRVQAEIDGDTYFPALDAAEWRLVSRDAHAADDRHRHAFELLRYERRRA